MGISINSSIYLKPPEFQLTMPVDGINVIRARDNIFPTMALQVIQSPSNTIRIQGADGSKETITLVKLAGVLINVLNTKTYWEIICI
jgi:hypothetical protein